MYASSSFFVRVGGANGNFLTQTGHAGSTQRSKGPRVAVVCHAHHGPSAGEPEQESSTSISLHAGKGVKRRTAMSASLALLLSSSLPFSFPLPVFSAVAPRGYRRFIDRFDGYSFLFPESWLEVRGSGQDCFFRHPSNLDENVSVEVSSPSSSRFKSIQDLGSPEDAGRRVVKQYLTEFMSTRLGVRREPILLSTSSRIAPDGREFYQVEVNVKSYANGNQLAIMPEERVQRLEWDRHYFVTLGVENGRLYELRIQTSERGVAEEVPVLEGIIESFDLFPILDL